MDLQHDAGDITAAAGGGGGIGDGCGTALSVHASWVLAGASVEKLGEAAACAVKRIHLDHRMIQVSC